MSLINRPITEDPVHVIYRLAGSLPRKILKQLRFAYAQMLDEYQLELRTIDPNDTAGKEIIRQSYQERLGQIQATYDEYLDRVVTGPSYLADPVPAKIIIDSWLFLENRHLLLIDAISVMPNHVHIQLSTTSHEIAVNSKELLASHRKWTARLINQYRNKKGEKVWATPFFDRDVRRNAFGTVFWYILDNPVKARLCEDYRSWPGNYWRAELVE